MATGDETQAGPRPSLPPRRPAGFGEEPLRFGDPGPQPDVPPRSAGAAKPQILAPQANEWAENRQEVEVVRNSRTGLVLLFLLALLVVALIALGLAALSAFGGGDDTETAGAGTESSLAPGEEGAEGTATSVPEVTTTVLDPNQFQVAITEEPFICDGGIRPFAQLSGAAPSEQVTFTSPQSPNLQPGTADASGALPIRWSCDPEQAGMTWELTATGVTSGKTATFLVAGANAAPTATTVAPTALSVSLVEDPFLCNGESRVFGGLSGADPGEEIALSSPQVPNLSNGTADANGELPIRWSCDPDQAGTTIELTATGVTSGRTVTFTFARS